MALNRTPVRTTYLYFLISLSIYILELLTFYAISEIYTVDIIQLNYAVRLFACVVAGIVYRNFLFKEVRRFYLVYAATATLVPLLATSFLFLGTMNISAEILTLKVIADILASVVGYAFLQLANAANSRNTK